MTSKKQQHRVVTFYSYKGGCGRTMAVANVAWRLARDHALHVIAVDWDLEAPGLHRYFGYTDGDLTDKKGVLEFIDEWLRSADDDENSLPDVAQWLLPPKGLPELQEGSILFLPAGRLDEHYGFRLAELDWRTFYATRAGGKAVERLRHSLRGEADIVLCDSRTGLADGALICLAQLPDGVVLMGSPNEQSIDGIERAAQIVARSDVSRGGRGRPRVWVSMARLPIVEETTLSRRWLDEHEPWFEAGIHEGLWSRTQHPNGLQSYLIPQRARWSLGEPVILDERVDTNEPLLVAYKALTRVIFEWAYEEHLSLMPPGPTSTADEARDRVKQAEKRGDAAGLGLALYELGRALFSTGDVDEAFAHMQRASGIHFALGVRAQYGRDKRWLGNLRRSQGFLDEALDYGKEALQISREQANREDEVAARHLIANVYVSQRRFDEARRELDLVRGLLPDIRAEWQAFVMISMALARFETRDLREARGLLDTAEAALPAENWRERGVALGLRGDIAREERNHQEALRFYEEALEFFERGADRRSQGEALVRIGILWRRQGELDRAIRFFERAMVAMGSGWDKQYVGVAQREKGCALRDQGKVDDAISSFKQALVSFDKPSYRYEVALTLREMSIALRREGRMSESLEALQQALRIFEGYNERGEIDATHRELQSTLKEKAEMDAA